MRPSIKILEEDMKEKVFLEAMEILEEIGFFIENNEAVDILQNAGIDVDTESFHPKGLGKEIS
ncbi:MAG: trimethylamine methyltransferase family protein [Candidatus Heimdallarchaeota archaeon]|nr:trimethylamine methyltransferase family protein [Candidatus Heimdallarchaeota archaeon]